ncbi:MAG TPA: GNAT family N-acetyltransferase [Bacteroidia bacterium]|nr:GNAT family N-acetyltransferase [Bacteroidia bacterium]
MSIYILETERCLLREMHPQDSLSIFLLNLHPDIFKFTTDPPFKNVSEAKKFLEKYDSYTRTGMGRWAIELKETKQFIGWCGLKLILEENEVDIGYRLLPEFWGSGYAVETALACCNKGLNEFGLKRIVARIHKENLRSIRVAEKMKMVYEKDLIYAGVPWLNYVYPIPDKIISIDKLMRLKPKGNY